ncbi:MAG TPA: L-seryl-tRNA(Sec) selenium transferase [Enhygromyxa sp.]|nr:L-seryl-tRNA(Sec) selenium transferase [Enhygromyxa sp.]
MSAADQLRRLPKVDRTLEHPALVELGLRRGVIRRVVVEAIDAERERILAAARDDREPSPPVADLDAIASRVRARLDDWLIPHPLPVLNATGVVLHTNLGRAPLSAEARAAALAAAGSCDLELDLETGKRGSRLDHLRPLLAALFEAEDALIVNNGAAALLLACTALGAPGGVALSRGQHVEIGDSFRVAEMAAAGGVPVIPVGSTNRTHLRDYQSALERASALLWVHRSNFEQRGFVADVELSTLGQLARERDVPLIADLGSGLVDAQPGEPTVTGYLEQGATIVGFSGDKLLGGPQAGLLVGSAAAVARCRRHPLARALRCGKLALAALHATAIAHLRPGAPPLPVQAMLDVDVDALRRRAERLCAQLGWPLGCVRESVATVGGGSLPGRELASVALVANVDSAHRAAASLRRARPAMIARVRADELWIDLRTLVDVDDEIVLASLRHL